MLLLCSRQAGKSTVGAALALWDALFRERSLVLLLSPTQRQSSEVMRTVQWMHYATGALLPFRQQSALQVQLANGSRIVSLPGNEETVRGYAGVTLLVIDEAARVDEALYYSVRPMLSVCQGRLIALSTPFGKRGWFFQEWEGPEAWHRVKITAPECPRIVPSFLDEERRSLGERWFRQEYLCSFEDMIGAVFSHADIQACLTDDVEPLF
jgi:phage terminase large subunit-like protein